MNVQYAVKQEDQRLVLYVLEVNPRASRTIPFVSKATGVPFAKIASKVMIGIPLVEQGLLREPEPQRISVKESVLPFAKFVGVDTILGPEMKSTGEVMGVSHRFPMAFAKSQLAAGTVLPTSGCIVLSVADRDKPRIVPIARRLDQMGYRLIATRGTAQTLLDAGIRVEGIKKIQEGHPNLIDLMLSREVHLIMNTPRGKGAMTDEGKIRATAVRYSIPYITTVRAMEAAVQAMETLRQETIEVEALQDRFPAFARKSFSASAASLSPSAETG